MYFIKAVLLVYMIVVNFNWLVGLASMTTDEDHVRGFLIENVTEGIFVGWPVLNIMLQDG